MSKSLITALLIVVALQGCGRSSGPLRTVKFRVMTSRLDDTARITIAGNKPSLGDWDPGAIALVRLDSLTWERSFQFPEGTSLEFKITRGSWSTEALWPGSVEHLVNATMTVERDTVLVLRIPGWLDIDGGITALTADAVSGEEGIAAVNGWRYHPGDNEIWSRADVSDGSWELTNTAMYPEGYPRSGWSGIGWFRLHVIVDSSLLNKPLALTIMQAGASELFLDGRRLYTFGKVGTSADEETTTQQRNPCVLTFGPGSVHVIAVRYSNHSAGTQESLRLSAGFELRLADLNPAVAARVAVVRRASTMQMVFTCVPTVLALFHFFLFLFYPRLRENFFYAVCMLGLAGLTFVGLQEAMTTSVAQGVMMARGMHLFRATAVLFGLLTFDSMVYRKIPRYIFVYVAAAIAVVAWGIVDPYGNSNRAADVFMLVAVVEGVRGGIVWRRSEETSGVWIVGVGFVLLWGIVIYQVLMGYGVILPIGGFRYAYVYGALALGISVSIYLSRSYARMSSSLERQLVQVKELSERTLAQERNAREQEIRQRLLEADNARKTEELDEARTLQLSLLPGHVPQLDCLKIAVYLKTATEVGGDYYDFYCSDHDTLTVVLGDATGHGARAGTMVAVAKSLFHELAPDPDILHILRRYGASIRTMNLGRVFMAMMIVRFNGRKLTATSAGMPPMFLHREAGGSVEEIRLRGMPLGSLAEFPYQKIEMELRPGDTLLLMSDGLPEMLNGEREMFDYPRLVNAFRECASLDPQQIIDHLVGEGARWAGNTPLADDVTMMVIRASV